MIINSYDIIGYVGVFFISINLIPQIYHTHKMKNSDAISFVFILFGLLSSFFMGLYGVLVEKNPIIISNSIMFCFYCIMLITKLYYNTNYSKISIPTQNIDQNNNTVNNLDNLDNV